jgi:hypothetical protein
MRKIEPDELQKILDLHGRWVGGHADGVRADLRDADLHRASLVAANLVAANLAGASLDGANFFGASLDGARLDGASLVGARLDRASLAGASLVAANLDGASLDGARLDGASLVGASLVGANLTPIRDDLWAVLSAAPAEVVGLRAAVAEGRIDGSSYEGDCACLVGTLAAVRKCDYDEIPGLRPNSFRAAERFFLAIKKGDTPETSQFSRLALEWVDQWLANMTAAFGGAGVAEGEVRE